MPNARNQGSILKTMYSEVKGPFVIVCMTIVNKSAATRKHIDHVFHFDVSRHLHIGQMVPRDNNDPICLYEDKLLSILTLTIFYRLSDCMNRRCF